MRERILMNIFITMLSTFMVCLDNYVYSYYIDIHVVITINVDMHQPVQAGVWLRWLLSRLDGNSMQMLYRVSGHVQCVCQFNSSARTRCAYSNLHFSINRVHS